MHKYTPLARAQGQRLQRGERRDAKRDFLRRYILHEGNNYPNISQACRALEISRGTFYGWCKIDALFSKKVSAIKAVWFDGDEALQKYGATLIRKVSPAALREAYQYVACTAYNRLVAEQMCSMSIFPAPPDDTDTQDFMQSVPSLDLGHIALEALLASLGDL